MDVKGIMMERASQPTPSHSGIATIAAVKHTAAIMAPSDVFSKSFC
jgi:hypothetical protein